MALSTKKKVAIGVGAAAVAIGVGLALSSKAHAALPPPSPSPPLPPKPGGTPVVGLPGTPSSQLVVGQSATVVAPSGIKLRTGPGTNFPGVGFLGTKASDGVDILGLGSVVAIAAPATPTGWVQVQVPGGLGFLCNDCRELNAVGVPIQAALHMTPGKPQLVANKQIPSASQPASSDSLNALASVVAAIQSGGDTSNPPESGGFFGPDPGAG